jgi:hypothetical protein
MESRCVPGLLAFALFGPLLTVSAQVQNCPHFSGVEKKWVESRGRWLVSESLRRQVKRRSDALGQLIAFEQCHVLLTGVLWGDFVAVEGPFFLAHGVPVKSLIAKYHDTWSMAVAPTDATRKMPNPNLLRVTGKKWTLFYRDESGMKTVVAAGTY